MDLKNKKVAFFDMDGTLVDSETLYFQTRKEVLAKYGFDYQKSENNKLLATGFEPTLRCLQQKTGDKALGQNMVLMRPWLYLISELKKGSWQLNLVQKNCLVFYKKKELNLTLPLLQIWKRLILILATTICVNILQVSLPVRM